MFFSAPPRKKKWSDPRKGICKYCHKFTSRKMRHELICFMIHKDFSSSSTIPCPYPAISSPPKGFPVSYLFTPEAAAPSKKQDLDSNPGPSRLSQTTFPVDSIVNVVNNSSNILLDSRFGYFLTLNLNKR